MALPVSLVCLGTVASSEDTRSDTAIDSILREIAAVGRRLEAMDFKIMDLSTASNSIRAEIATFQDKVLISLHRIACLYVLPDYKTLGVLP
ncbi:hypothetical protein NDU88_002173 [Pleurodeles waltl]|uniref:Uncharacterized protein n=1 Tax=Pleurodeles waltl TaxID=8319 RepID=A0AAV7LEZ0_PLEWA|nr:hypothetical protein NDU88_002173 [Pleurodeles waltl]